eukprot:5455166-Alexandrium_andersonii.AAC.1
MDVGADGDTVGVFGAGDPVVAAGQRFKTAVVGLTAARPGPGPGRRCLSRPGKWEPGGPEAQGGNQTCRPAGRRVAS